MQLDSLTDRRTTSILGEISEEEKFKGIRFSNRIKSLRPFRRKEMISGSLRGHFKHSAERGKEKPDNESSRIVAEISPRRRAQRKSRKGESFLVVVHVDAFNKIWLINSKMNVSRNKSALPPSYLPVDNYTPPSNGWLPGNIQST